MRNAPGAYDRHKHIKNILINIGTIKSNKIKLSKTKITKFKSNNVKN